MTSINQTKGIQNKQSIDTTQQRSAQIERNAQRFQQILDQEIVSKKSIRISAHAQQRLEQRNITLSDADLEALNRGMEKAENKGAKESLLLYKDLALIASVRNRTVITAVSQSEAKENVFTNIDSAVIIDE
jgi:flagellar operon protein